MGRETRTIEVEPHRIFSVPVPMNDNIRTPKGGLAKRSPCDSDNRGVWLDTLYPLQTHPWIGQYRDDMVTGIDCDLLDYELNLNL